MSRYSGYSDDYYMNVNLVTELELPTGRDTLLHFFEQVKKQYPTMRNFHSRDRGECILEEDKDSGQYRWVSVENKRISSGFVNPPDVEAAAAQHAFIFDMIPYSLSVSPLDCESLNLIFGFDFAYRGNQHELVANALGVAPAFEPFLEIPGAKNIAQESNVTMALEENCRTQFRLQIEPRTSTYHIRTGEFQEESISVYLTVRRYSSLEPNETFVSKIQQLQNIACDLLDKYVVPQVLVPLQRTISMK